MEKLENCPNCGGILDDLGRCEFCGSKVYDLCDEVEHISGLKMKDYLVCRCEPDRPQGKWVIDAVERWYRMSNERPFENIDPVPNIKVGYFEKEEYLKIIDGQAKQIESLGWQIMALQARNDLLEKIPGPKGKWELRTIKPCERYYCSECGEEAIDLESEPEVYGHNYCLTKFCPNCGADMRGEE